MVQRILELGPGAWLYKTPGQGNLLRYHRHAHVHISHQDGGNHGHLERVGGEDEGRQARCAVPGGAAIVCGKRIATRQNFQQSHASVPARDARDRDRRPIARLSAGSTFFPRSTATVQRGEDTRQGELDLPG